MESYDHQHPEGIQHIEEECSIGGSIDWHSALFLTTVLAAAFDMKGLTFLAK